MTGTPTDYLKELLSTEKPPNLDQVEVVEGGAVIADKNKMRPDVMQFLMLASIASQAVKVRKYFDDRTSEGFTQNFALVVTPVPQRVKCDFPSQTLYVINDGPNPIFVEINARFTTATQLNITEDMFVDFETHKLIEFWVYCLPAGAATARAFAKR